MASLILKGDVAVKIVKLLEHGLMAYENEVDIFGFISMKKMRMTLIQTIILINIFPLFKLPIYWSYFRYCQYF